MITKSFYPAFLHLLFDVVKLFKRRRFRFIMCAFSKNTKMEKNSNFGSEASAGLRSNDLLCVIFRCTFSSTQSQTIQKAESFITFKMFFKFLIFYVDETSRKRNFFQMDSFRYRKSFSNLVFSNVCQKFNNKNTIENPKLL